jgi:hypothetical protein
LKRNQISVHGRWVKPKNWLVTAVRAELRDELLNGKIFYSLMEA